MSFYRNLIVAVAAMGLGTAVFADDAMPTTTTTTTDTTTSAPAATDASADNTAAVADKQTTTTTTTMESSDKVDLNKATAKQLMKLKGVNAARAKAIVAYRKKHGDFKSVDEIKEVKGFKKMKDKHLQEVEDQLTVQ